MANISPPNPLQYLIKRQSGDVIDIKTDIFDKRLNAAKNLFKRDLICHYGCVNAIEFSDDGELLISGGDDRRVMLWKFSHTVFDRGQPEQMNNQHMSNIFCLAITSDNKKIFSGGNDDQVIVHDTERKCALEVLPHLKAVCGLAIDPFNERIVSTAGNDGRLLIFDTRQSIDESLVLSKSRKAFHAVSFHPTQLGVMVSANARDGAALWDLRAPKHAVLRYGGNNGLQNCMSVRFNTGGTQVLALRRRLPPVLYDVHRAEPRAQFYHPDYYNSCTMKSCCFAGERDQYLLSGSDDFNLYMWKIPEDGGWVDQTHMVLYGHRSIVNQVRYNRQLCLIASSGVEKIIKTWSPVELPGSTGCLLEEANGPDNPRDVYSHEEYVTLVHHSGQYISHNYADQSTSEDPRMMAFFDSLVQREIEGWTSEDSDSQSDSGSGQSAFRILSKDTDSSDSDQIVVDFLPLPPKRTTNGARNQRSQNRIARLIATRQSKILRLSQKRMRRNKQQRGSVAPTAVTAAGAGKRTGRRAGRPTRATRPSPPTSDQRSDSDEPAARAYRHTGKIIRPLRRRMNLSRNLKRKTKNMGYRKMDIRNGNGSSLHDGSGINGYNMQNCDDNLAVPSTSTGFRGHSNTAMFRITEIDSDDDQSAGSGPKSPADNTTTLTESLPLVNIVPTPINGSREIINTALRINIPEPQPSTAHEPRTSYPRHHLPNRRPSHGTRHRVGRAPVHHSDSSESPPIKETLRNGNGPPIKIVRPLVLDGDFNPTYRPTTASVARLMNETNESEIESSCSTGSTVRDTISPVRLFRSNIPVEAATPDSGIHTGPCSSTSSAQSQATVGNGGSVTRVSLRHNVPEEWSDEPEWVAIKHRQRVKKARRNYRKHIGDSDSN